MIFDPRSDASELTERIAQLERQAARAYADGRRDLLSQLRGDGCPHGCRPPCPYTETLNRREPSPDSTRAVPSDPFHTCTHCHTLYPSAHPRCIACGEPTPGGPLWRARMYGEQGRIVPNADAALRLTANNVRQIISDCERQNLDTAHAKEWLGVVEAALGDGADASDERSEK